MHKSFARRFGCILYYYYILLRMYYTCVPDSFRKEQSVHHGSIFIFKTGNKKGDSIASNNCSLKPITICIEVKFWFFFKIKFKNCCLFPFELKNAWFVQTPHFAILDRESK